MYILCVFGLANRVHFAHAVECATTLYALVAISVAKRCRMGTRLPPRHGPHRSKARTCHVAFNGGDCVRISTTGWNIRVAVRHGIHTTSNNLCIPALQVAAPATAATEEEESSPPKFGVVMSRTMRRHDEAAASKDISSNAGGNVAPTKELNPTLTASAPIN